MNPIPLRHLFRRQTKQGVSIAVVKVPAEGGVSKCKISVGPDVVRSARFSGYQDDVLESTSCRGLEKLRRRVEERLDIKQTLKKEQK